jgi:hypothetical protein
MGFYLIMVFLVVWEFHLFIFEKKGNHGFILVLFIYLGYLFLKQENQSCWV